MPGMPGTNQALLEVSGRLQIDFGRRLKYLTGYPHGCTEQIVSAAFPQLYLDKVMELPVETISVTEKNVREAINKVYNLQMTNGGIRYWPGQTSAGDWITSYAGHFVLEAGKKGYTMPPGFLDSWTSYQERAANQWRMKVEDFRGYREQSALEQAYRLFTLALAGKPQLSAMNRLKETAAVSLQAKWRLAAAYVLAGQPEVASDLLKNLGTEPPQDDDFTSTYGSALRDQGMILETLTLLGDDEKSMQLALRIAESMSDNQWYSTQTTAYCLVALAGFIGEDKAGKGSFGFDLAEGPGERKQITSSGPVYQYSVNPGANSVTVTNLHDHKIYLSVYMSGIPLEDPGIDIAENLEIEVRYYNMNEEPVRIEGLEQGTDFIAEVTVTNPGIMGSLKDMALTQIFPSGWEIINTRLIGSELAGRLSTPDYQDIRDDRVYTYFDIGPGNIHKFRVLLNAAYLGTFYLPPVSCEAMYDNNVQARKAGKWVEIVKPGSIN
jgi:uncharacterized protein YfaS (alpha-2-macroglobulin family)